MKVMENYKTENEKDSGKYKKMTGLKKQKMAIDVAFTFLKILFIAEASNRKEVTQVGSARKETVRVGVAIASSLVEP